MDLSRTRRFFFFFFFFLQSTVLEHADFQVSYIVQYRGGGLGGTEQEELRGGIQIIYTQLLR